MTSRLLKNPFRPPIDAGPSASPCPLPGQEGGGNCIWGIAPSPHPFGFAQGRLRGFAPLDSLFHYPASARAVVALLLMAVLTLWGQTTALAQGGGAVVEGQVVNGTTAEGVVSGLTVVLHQHGTGDGEDVPAATDGTGRFRFDNVEVVPGFAYGVSVEHQGAMYGQDLELSPGKTSQATLTVYESTQDAGVIQTVSASILFASVDQRGQWVGTLEMVTVRNASNRTYVPGPEPMKVLRFSLPPGAQDLEVRTGLLGAEDVLQVDRGFGLPSPVPPGDHDLLFAYRFPYKGPSISFTKALPYGAGQLRVLIPQGAVHVASHQMGSPAVVTIGQRAYEVLTLEGLAPGATVEVSLEGLPQATLFDRGARLTERVPLQYLPVVALALVALSVITYVLVRSRRRPRGAGGSSDGSPLAEARQELAQALAALEGRRAGGLDDARYEEERRRLAGQLAAVERGVTADKTSHKASDSRGDSAAKRGV